MVVTAKNCNEKMNKKISTRIRTFSSLGKQKPSPPSSATATTTTITRTTPVTVRKAITRYSR